MSLSRTIKSIQDILRKDSGLDGDPQRISQLVWMLFLKMFDDTEDSNKTPIPEKIKWRVWTKVDSTDDELINFVNNTLFPTLRALPDVIGQVPRAKLIEEIFSNSHNYMTSGSLMRQVIKRLDTDFNFKDAENRHLFNDIYETILKDIQNSRYSGEYYTPRPVTQFIVDRISPKIEQKILDPACGTGGFLSSAIDFLNQKYPGKTESLQRSILGIEKKSLPYMLCVTNLMLHGIEIPSILKANAFHKSLKAISDEDRVDVILTNPPFGGVEEENVLKEFTNDVHSKETADLFILLIMEMLRPGGKAGVVLPDGFLFGTGVKTKIKEKLIKEFNLHTIVRLPRGVFSPYTDINTNVLFFDKGTATKEIWYYEHPLPAARKGKPYNKSNPIQLDEFDTKWWDNRLENGLAWLVPIETIIKNDYNLDVKNPVKRVDIDDKQSTKDIFEQIVKNQKNINTIFDSIQKELFS
jgi:type I restriction enzyme M protein